jgi:AraC-like DNA-binding protein
MGYARTVDSRGNRLLGSTPARGSDCSRPHVLVLAAIGEEHSCLHRRMGAKYELSIYESGDELIDAVRARPEVAAILADLWDAHGQPVAPALKAMHRAFPTIPIIVCCRLAPGAAPEILAVARAGINALALRGFDDVNAKLASLLSHARNDCDATCVLAAIRPYLRENEVPIVEYCVAHARHKISVGEVAEALSLSRRTLSYRLASGCLLSAHSLIVWSRLLIAARLLQDTGRTIESVALSLQFGSAAAFRNMLRRQAGLSPAKLRVHGGQAFLLNAFTGLLASRERGLQTCRRPGREPRTMRRVRGNAYIRVQRSDY